MHAFSQILKVVLGVEERLELGRQIVTFLPEGLRVVTPQIFVDDIADFKPKVVVRYTASTILAGLNAGELLDFLILFRKLVVEAVCVLQKKGSVTPNLLVGSVVRRRQQPS